MSLFAKELYALAMFAATCGFLIAGFPVAFTLAGVALLFGLAGAGIGAFDTAFLMAMPQRIFGTMTNDVLIAAPLFVFMGVMLERSKVAEDLLESMGRLFGSLRGGLGLSVCVVGALLAASTGIVGATVVTMGLLSLPTMLRRGYDPALTCGTICAAGTLGQIIPPSIVLVLLGDQISNAYGDAQRALGNWSPDPVSVGDLFAGALIPGLALVGLYMLYVIVIAWLRPSCAPAMPSEGEKVALGQTLLRLAKALLAPVLLIVAVLGSILAGVATPTEAAALGAVGALLLGGLRSDANASPLPIHAAGLGLVLVLVMVQMFDLRINRTVIGFADGLGLVLATLGLLAVVWGLVVSLRRLSASGVLWEVSRSTAQISSMVFVIVIGAGLFSLVFRGLGGEAMVHQFLSDLPGGVVGAMLVVMLVMFIMGFFLDFIEIIFVVVPIVGPVLLKMGLDPVWLGVMMAMNLQTSFLTPPFGFALFYLRGVAPPEISTMHIYRGVVPFILIQILALGLLALFPQGATWLPKVVFG
ncbi:TRAP transporter large permease [Pararhodospirillum photometricum]|uniref:TRAP-type mannitol/chloroaromatic compound transport system, large permease component n=1 Tax=Pararhodospirillum photometricum DSM 122 TaxID=1150469 RepID=H6SRF1_PARPM|nr:TRAP transporter large permease subunit [Pararhodospirillum photometricum]CCG07480.1 TRAP-type mannitol/chloroaromatic compound transport system, large permease component [Pararhodospirillum photometricum DSM 122]